MSSFAVRKINELKANLEKERVANQRLVNELEWQINWNKERLEAVDKALSNALCDCASVFKAEGYRSHQVQCSYRILREQIEHELSKNAIAAEGLSTAWMTGDTPIG